MFAEKIQQFIANYFYDLLIGRKLQQHFLAERFGADIGRAIHRPRFDGHIAFEHGFADLRERGVQVLFAELSLAAQIFKSALKFVG